MRQFTFAHCYAYLRSDNCKGLALEGGCFTPRSARKAESSVARLGLFGEGDMLRVSSACLVVLGLGEEILRGVTIFLTSRPKDSPTEGMSSVSE